MARSRSLSRSRSPSRSPPRRRSYSRSRSPMRSVSPRRSYSRSPQRSVSRSPRARSRSRTPPRNRIVDYKARLEALYDTGKVKESDIDITTFDALEALEPDVADGAVQRFSEANFGKVMNKNGFFMGIIRRVKQDGPDRDGNTLDSLPRPVRYRLQDLVDDRRISAADIETRMCKALYDMPGDQAVEAVERFAMVDLDKVRSKTGFMIGIIRRVQDDMSRRGGGGGGYDRRDFGRDRDRGGYGRDRDRDYRRDDRRDDRDRRDRY